MVVYPMRFRFAKWACDRQMPILPIKINFSDKAHYLGGYVNKQNCCIEKPIHQNESLFGADFGPEAKLSHFSSKMSKEWPLQSMAIVIGSC